MKKLKCYQWIGVFFALVNFLIFIRFFSEAIGMDAQYQLLWIPLSIIDFPITVFFFLLMFVGVPPNISALIVFGVLGTFWWYWLASFIAKKFKKCK